MSANNYTAPGVTPLRATSAADLTVTFYDGDTPGDPGIVTVTITRLSDGTAVVTDGATTGTGAAARTRRLTNADTATLDFLTAVWSGTVNGNPVSITTRYEVVGDHLFSLDEARAFDRLQLASDTTYPDAAIMAARQRITAWFEQICGVAFFPRYRRVILDGDGGDTLFLPDLRVTALRDAAIRASGGATWTALTVDELAGVQLHPIGLLVRESLGSWTAGRRNIRVGYECGHEQVPEPLNYAALKVLTSQIVPSNLSDRAIQEAGQYGVIQLATPNPAVKARWFGLPVVDSILNEFCERLPAIA